MRYYAVYDGEGRLKLLGTGSGGVEITKETYDTLTAQLREKAALTAAICAGEKTMEDVPQAWREEISRWVQSRMERLGASAENEEQA